MKHVQQSHHLWLMALVAGAVFMKPGIAEADRISGCRDSHERATFRVVSVAIDGIDDPEHPAVGSEAFSLSATDEGDMNARLADPVTGTAQSIHLKRISP